MKFRLKDAFRQVEVAFLTFTVGYRNFTIIKQMRLKEEKESEQGDTISQHKQSLSKEYSVNNHKINYNSTSVVSHDQQFKESFRVTNEIFQCQGNQLRKVTRIYSGSAKITIEDIVQIREKPEETPSSSQQMPKKEKKIQQTRFLKRRRRSGSNQEEVKKETYRRDTKNIVKNVIKLFLQWLSKDQFLEARRAHVLELTEKERYNNNFIKQLSRRPEINETFLQFLSSKAAQSLVRESKILDKESHLEALENYQHYLSKIIELK